MPRGTMMTRSIAFATLAGCVGVIALFAASGTPMPTAPKAAIAAVAPAKVPVASPVPPASEPVAVDSPYVVKRVLDVPEPLRHGAYYWDTEGVPEGPIVITVDLVAQTLSIFRSGYEIGTAAVI